jgi:hypothetical protein
MDWYSNPWFIGIVGSIPGGFLVNWASGYFLGKRENREYLQKVIGANREIVYAIRPGISEGQIPTADVLTALANATARRYSVEASELYSPSQIAEELVKEVMDSSFISSAQKADYCARLTELGGLAKRQAPELAHETQSKAIAEFRDSVTSRMSMLMGVLTVVVSMMMTLLEFLRTKKAEVANSILPDAGKFDAFVPVLAATLSMAVAVALMVFYRDFLRRKREDAAEREIRELRVRLTPRQIRKKPDE